MIISQIQGGLGNQLFQYAIGRSLAEKNNTTLGLDVSWFEKHPERPFRLDQFNIKATLLSKEQVLTYRRINQNDIYSRLYRGIDSLLPYYRRTTVRERSYQFDKNILNARNNACLIGFWQSYKYFTPITLELIQELKLSNPLHPYHEVLSHEISGCDAVSVHIRKGDYLSAKNTRYFISLGRDYYEKAFDILSKKVGNTTFFVFSDDIAWAKENIKIDGPYHFVEPLPGNLDYEVLSIMSLCKHHIIANSTFSWWAAWLCQYEKKTVITPQKWFTDESKHVSDIIPDGWLAL